MSIIKNLILLTSNISWLPYTVKFFIICSLECTFNFFCFWRKKSIKPDKVEDKLCLITGGTKNIGKKLVELLKDSGYKIYVLGRTDIQDDDAVKYIKLDLNDLTAVQNFSFSKHIDLLIFNAGIWTSKVDKIDVNFRVNFLGHFLLYEKLKKNLSKTRVVVTSSCLALTVDSFDPTTTSFSLWNRKYSESKFCVFLLGRYISKDHQTVVVHPGIVPTALFDEDILSILFIKLLYFSTNTIEEGANVLLNACHVSLMTHHRLVFFDGFDRVKIPKSVNEKNLEKLMTYTEKFLETYNRG